MSPIRGIGDKTAGRTSKSVDSNKGHWRQNRRRNQLKVLPIRVIGDRTAGVTS
ncbi:hypothetical protein [Bacillus sp. FJAT-29814]|uniref:hypothetical protein n=1 Tax=Bacillus sp. FJAT-29814 TaxID=1729688 RepID=UPI000B1D0FD6|nr:hypothetical protein [Bacillus sp. FJAT-29814]